MTHCRFASEKCSLRPIVGSATLTIVRSTMVMKNATASTANALQRCTGIAALGSSVTAVTRSPPARDRSRRLCDGAISKNSPVARCLSPDRNEPRGRLTGVAKPPHRQRPEAEDRPTGETLALTTRAHHLDLAV